jgi:hypothetical protein
MWYELKEIMINIHYDEKFTFITENFLFGRKTFRHLKKNRFLKELYCYAIQFELD